ncbi:MAG: hypothetical protein RIB80_04810 [Rhodospirillales bacterium]
MSDGKKDGGPAFPISTIDGFTNQGMTLRQWYAGQALVGLLANTTYDLSIESNVESVFEYADATP